MNLDRQSKPAAADQPEMPQDTDSSIDRLAAGAAVSILGVGVGRGLDFAKLVIMARLLGPEMFGLYALGWNFLRIIGILAPLGLHNGVVNFATRYWRVDSSAFKSIITRSVGISFAVGWIVTMILFVLAPWITAALFKEPEFLSLFRIFLLMLPFMGALRVAANASRISQRMQYAVASEEIAQASLNLVLFIAFYILGWQLFGAIVATVLSFVGAFIISIYYLARLFPNDRRAPSRKAIADRTLLVFSIPTALAGVFSVLISRVDRIFLGYFWPSSEVGVYQAAAQLSVIMALVLNAFNMILTPMIADQYNKRNMKHLEELFRINTKWGIYCVIPVVLLIVFTAEDLMSVLFGQEYIGGATALSILTLGQFVNIATGATGLMLIMTGNQTVWFRLSVIILAINLVLNLTLIPGWGMNGAALATAITVGGLFIIGLIIVRQILHIWPYDRRYYKGLVAGLIPTVFLFGIRAFNLDPLPNLLLSGLVSGFTFIAVLVRLGLEPEDREFIGIISKRFSSR
jgi:O-antigen/teichoic acid export membrane protein